MHDDSSGAHAKDQEAAVCAVKGNWFPLLNLILLYEEDL
jgi:hypothetical protein